MGVAVGVAVGVTVSVAKLEYAETVEDAEIFLVTIITPFDSDVTWPGHTLV